MPYRDAQQEKLTKERLHYLIFRSLVPNNDFNAIKYLYDRLNIIDAKAQGLLTRNGLLLTVISIVGAVKLRGGSSQVLQSAWEQYAFVLGFVLLAFSTIYTASFMFFRFDHVTEIPNSIRLRLEHYCDCAKNGKLDARWKPIEDCKNFKSCAFAAENRLEAFWPKRHSLEEYEDLFFKITIERQSWLRLAQCATFGSIVIFFLLIGYEFWSSLCYLPFHTR